MARNGIVYTQDAVIYPVRYAPRGPGRMREHTQDALALAALLATNLHSRQTKQGVYLVHPGDDRLCTSLGWDQARLDAAVKTLAQMGMWKPEPSQIAVGGRSYRLAVDITEVERPAAWEQEKDWNPKREAMQKVLCRFHPELSSAATLVGLYLSGEVKVRRPGEVKVWTQRLVTLFPGVSLDSVFYELYSAQIVEVIWLDPKRERIGASLHSKFIEESASFESAMLAPHEGVENAETRWEREWLEAHAMAGLDRAARKAEARTQQPSLMYYYLLIDPRTATPFYVGISGDPEERLREHIEMARTGDGLGEIGDANYESNKKKRETILSLMTEGLEPQMLVLNPSGIETDRAGAEVEEEALIQLLHRIGTPLVNRQYLEGPHLNPDRIAAFKARNANPEKGTSNAIPSPRNAFAHESPISR